MGELLEREPINGEAIFGEALGAQNLSASFVDDTLVALLQSAAAGLLVSSHEAGLLSSERQNLKRVIHLVRLACVTTPAWAQGSVGALSVPRGTVWPALLGIVRRGWSHLDSESSLLVLGLVEDWARGVSRDDPYPPGADDAAAIAYTLLDSFDNYSHEDELRRAIQIIAKIPNANANRYRELLLTPRQSGRDRSRVAEKLQEVLFCGPFYESLPTARDMSSSLISGLRSHLLCSDDDLPEEFNWSSSLRVELCFGLRSSVGHHYFPESAYRTPMLSLLREHPRAAIDFLIELFNHVADWYAHPRIADPLGPAFEVTIKLPNGNTKAHSCNSRLWQLYRGTSVGPDVLQSYLMALERWLRDLAKYQPDLLDANHDRTARKLQHLIASWNLLSEVHAAKQRIVLCHYAMRVWPHHAQGAWHLYGHSHGNLPDEPLALSLDVGVDTHEFRPWHFDEIQAVMQPKAVDRESRFQAGRRAALADLAAYDQIIEI